MVHIAAPLFHSWGFAHFSLGLILGNTYVLRRKFDPESALAEVARTRADALVVVPVMMQRILDLPKETRAKYDVSSLKVVARQRLGAAGRPGHPLDGRVRRHALQPLRLHRGRLGLDRHARPTCARRPGPPAARRAAPS